MKLILATASPYRKRAFAFLGLDFVVRESKINEYFDGRPNFPKKLVAQLAKLKTESVAKYYKTGIVIGFDSVGWFNGKILEKPKSRREAFLRLKSLSEKRHQFYTGVYMRNLNSGKSIAKTVVTDAWMRNLTDWEINKYLDQDANFNTYALGFDPLGHYSSSFIKEFKGSYNNFLRGIPLEVIVEMLPKVGYKLGYE